jgi:hypothetical protein
MSYQAVIRNSANALVTSTSIGMRISILQGSASGTEVYAETQTPTTNANGLVNIEIGNGAGFATINWANGPYFIKTETDPTGGTNYTITGTSQLLSVPYSLNAKTAETADYNNLTNLPTLNIDNWNAAYSWGNHALAGYLTSYTETDPIFVASPANGITTTNISNWNTAFGWGNHSGLYRPVSWVPAWTDITGKPTTLAGYGITDAMSTSHAANVITTTNITNWNTAYGWGNHSGLYRPVSWVPAWTDITGKPTTVSGYGITDAMTTSHAANGITSTNITNWNTAYGWGNHAGLYRPISYVPAWSEITSNPFNITAPSNNQILKYNSTSSKWENWTPTYLTAEVDGSVTNEIELPAQTGNTGKYLTTDGTTPSWVVMTKATIGLGNAENTAISTWAGSLNLTTLGTITTGTWHGTAINASYIDVLPTSKITSGVFDNARINWAAPGTIGSTTASSGAFTSLSASNGLTISNGAINIKPSGSGGTNGYVLTTDGTGNVTWKAPSTASIPVSTHNSDYTITTSDGLIITNGGVTFTLPSSASAGMGKVIYLFSVVAGITLSPAPGNTLWDNSGNAYTYPATMASVYSGMFVSDGVNTWYQVVF